MVGVLFRTDCRGCLILVDAGGKELEEIELDHLDGHKGSK